MKLSYLLTASALLFVTPVSSHMFETNAVNQTPVTASEPSWGNVNNIHFTDNFSQFNSGVAKLTVGTPVEVTSTISFSGDYAAIQQAVVSFEKVGSGIQIDYDHMIYFDPDTKQASFKFTITLTEPIPAGGTRLFTVKVSDNKPEDNNTLTPYSQRQTIVQGDDGGSSTSSTDSNGDHHTGTTTTSDTSTDTTTTTSSTDTSSTDTSSTDTSSTDTSSTDTSSTDTSSTDTSSTDTSSTDTSSTDTSSTETSSTDTSSTDTSSTETNSTDTSSTDTSSTNTTSTNPSTDTNTESTTESSSNTGENSTSGSQKDSKDSSTPAQKWANNQPKLPRSSVNDSKNVSSQAKQSGYRLLPKTGESDTSLFMIAGGLISLFGAVLLLKRNK